MTPSTPSDLDRLKADQPALRVALDARREVLEGTSRLRESLVRQEEPIRRWEIEVREKSPSGSRWHSMLADGKDLLTATGETYGAVLGIEKEGLEHLRTATDHLRDLLPKPDVDLDPRLPEMLEQCARLREQEIRWLEEIVNLTGRIESLNGEAKPEQVRSLLELRRRFLDQVRMLTDTSCSLEERALEFTTEPPAEDGPAGGATANGTTVEEILDVEFEDLDAKLRTFSGERDQALAKLAAVESKHEEEIERRTGLEGRLSAAQKKLVEAAARIEAQERLVDGVRKEKGVVAARLSTTESTLRKETGRREGLEEDLLKTEEDRDRTLALLAEAEARAMAARSEFDGEKEALLARIEDAKASCERTEVRRREELRRLREAFRGLTSRIDEEIRGFEGEA